MANNENLTPVKKGQILNPKGKKKGTRNRSTIVKEMLQMAALKKHGDKMEDVFGDQIPENLSLVDQMTAVMVARALAGDVTAYRELMDAGYGKLTDKLDNLHSFTAMGRVTAKLPASDGGKGEPESVALTFDVGSDPLHDKEDS